MLMVGALSVVEQHSPVQLFVGCLITTGYMLLVLRAAPYQDDSLDRLSFLTSLSLSMTLLLCLMKGTDEHRAEREAINYDENPWGMFNDASLSKLMIVLNILPFMYAAGSSLMRWWQHRKKICASLSSKFRRRSKVSPEKKTELELAPRLDAINFPGSSEKKSGKGAGGVRSWSDGNEEAAGKAGAVNAGVRNWNK